MLKRTVVLYRPNGTTATFKDVKSVHVDDKDCLWIVPNPLGRLEGQTIMTNLSFTVTETED